MGLCVETKEELRMTSVNVVTRHTNYLLMFLICDDNDGQMFSFMKIDGKSMCISEGHGGAGLACGPASAHCILSRDLSSRILFSYFRQSLYQI